MTHPLPAHVDLMKPNDCAPDTRSLPAPALHLFWAIIFGWAGGLRVADVALAPRAPGWGNAVLIVAGFGPSPAAFLALLAIEGGDGFRRWLRRCLVRRLGTGWYLLALGAPLARMLAAVGADGALTGVWLPSPAIGHIERGLLQFGLILVLGGPRGEEFGWRGCALAALTGRFGWRWASLGFGAVWGLWHLPLFYLPGMAQAQMPMALFMASSVALSVIMARMTLTTGFSILPALMFHRAINGWPSFVPNIPVEGNVRPYALAMVLLFLAAIVVLAKPGPQLLPSAPA